MLSSGLRHQVKGRVVHPRAVVVDEVAAGVARGAAALVLITGGNKWVYAVAILWFWNEKLRLLFCSMGLPSRCCDAGRYDHNDYAAVVYKDPGWKTWILAGITSICYRLSDIAIV